MYAREHGELGLFRQSNAANIACRAAVEEAIRSGFDGMHLNPDAAKAVIRDFGAERVEYVLANTVQQKAWDGRFSRDNKEWAKRIEAPVGVGMGMDHGVQFVVSSHPAVLDGFISQVREAMRENQPSIRQQLQRKTHASVRRTARRETDR